MVWFMVFVNYMYTQKACNLKFDSFQTCTISYDEAHTD
jgi:hypothetical protein